MINIYQTPEIIIDFYLEDISSVIHKYKDRYIHVGYIDSSGLTLEEVFYKGNDVDNEDIIYLSIFRSLSVGDVIEYDDKWYCCAPSGWLECQSLIGKIKWLD